MTAQDDESPRVEWKIFHPKHSYPLTVKEALADYCPNDSWVRSFRDIPWPFALKRLAAAAKRLQTASGGALTLAGAKMLVAQSLRMSSWRELQHTLTEIEAYDVWQHFNPTEFFYNKVIEGKTRELCGSDRVNQLLQLESRAAHFIGEERLLRSAMRSFLEATWPIAELWFATPAQCQVLLRTQELLQGRGLPDTDALAERTWEAPAGAFNEAKLADVIGKGLAEGWTRFRVRPYHWANELFLEELRNQHPGHEEDIYWLTGEQLKQIVRRTRPVMCEAASPNSVSLPMLCQVLPNDAVLNIESRSDFGALTVTAIHCRQSAIRTLKRLGWYPSYSWNSHDWRRFYKNVPLAATVRQDWGLAVADLI